MQRFVTREAWLTEACVELDKLIAEQGYEPAPVRPSAGFPSRRPLALNNNRIGECWSPDASDDGVPCVFISPLLSDSVDVLATLLHEQVHAVVGLKEGHNKVFGKLARGLGLEGKLTSTHAGEQLAARLGQVAEGLGEYPQPRFDPRRAGLKKQTTRMLKVVAVDCCGYTVRTTKKWLEEVGLPSCPHGAPMVAA